MTKKKLKEVRSVIAYNMLDLCTELERYVNNGYEILKVYEVERSTIDTSVIYYRAIVFLKK